MAFPQYAQSTDPIVIATIERNATETERFHERACDFAQAHGVPDGAYYRTLFAGSYAVFAIGGDTKPTTGRWAKHPRAGWRPFKNTPLYAEMKGLGLRLDEVPGLPQLVESSMSGDGRRTISSPTPFVLDGVAYVGFSFRPENGDDTDLWTEVKASEFFRAMETWNEQLAAKAA